MKMSVGVLRCPSSSPVEQLARATPLPPVMSHPLEAPEARVPRPQNRLPGGWLNAILGEPRFSFTWGAHDGQRSPRDAGGQDANMPPSA